MFRSPNIPPLSVHPTLIVWLSLLLLSALLPRHNGALAEQPTDGSVDPARELEFFESKVRPLLVEHCYACHSAGAEKLQAGLRLDSRDALIHGGDSGSALVPGDADASLLVEAVRYEGYEMPPRGKLSEQDIETIVRWVDRGAVWPDEPPADGEVSRPQFNLQQRAQEHWAWQPLATPELPTVQAASWPRSDLDYFVLARLEAAGIRPAADADRWVLLRRLYFDLIGLPPTPEQVQQFLTDDRPDAVPRLVDDLLQSPHFGERWGRHWLDLVRYAESRGHEFDDDAENAYQYRDYVIRALNADVPYDQFVREHIAGDLLTSPRLHPANDSNESILGTGFWFLGEWVHSPVDIRKDEADRFDNMLDVMSKTFLGLTVACARCHDHKFDAISTADYYSLSGFLQSSDFRHVRFEAIEHNRAIAQQLSELDAQQRQALERLLGESELVSGNTEPSQVSTQAALLNQPPRNQPALNQPALNQPSLNELLNGALAKHVLVHYAELAPTDYLQDGYVFGTRPSTAGELILGGTEHEPHVACAPHTAAVSDTFWDGLQSIQQPDVQSRSALSKIPRSGRTLRTPSFTLEHGQVNCRVQGEGHVVACVDSHRLVAGPLHAETVVKIKPGQGWVKLNLDRYVGHRLHLEFTPAEKTQLAISCVLQGPTADMLQVIEQYEADEQRQAAARQSAIKQRLSQDAALAAQVQLLLQDWSAQRQTLKSQVKTHSQLAMAMLDGIGEDDHILIRGSSANPGRVEPRHFLTALTGDQPLEIARGSGRLELAEHINNPRNPLTSRVIVNRLWHHLLGRGIVPTTDDLGVLGQAPTDPLLLDFLATRFLRNGQSIKHAIREIVLSRTYQQSGQFDAGALQLDPNNELWHYRPPKRLEGEVIRDALLAISGQLDPTQFGPPIPVHLTPFMDGRGRPAKSGPLDGAGRRTIYVAVRRNFLSPFLMAFDTPTPFSTMGRRTSSNVPAQALILMNDPFVIDQTRHWALRALELQVDNKPAVNVLSEHPPALIDWFFASGLGRYPTQAERRAAADFLTQQISDSVAEQTDEPTRPRRHDTPDKHKTNAAPPTSETAAWIAFAHALVNTKEFIFLR